MRVPIRRVVASVGLVMWVAVSSAACEYGVNTSPTSPTTATSTTTTTTTTVGLTYVKDIAPIMTSDCLSCHGPSRRDAGYNFSTYAGVMAAVSSTTSSAKLVRSTQPGGVMYGQFRSNASTKAKTIYDWVVTYKAVQQ